MGLRQVNCMRSLSSSVPCPVMSRSGDRASTSRRRYDVLRRKLLHIPNKNHQHRTIPALHNHQSFIRFTKLQIVNVVDSRSRRSQDLVPLRPRKRRQSPRKRHREHRQNPNDQRTRRGFLLSAGSQLPEKVDGDNKESDDDSEIDG